MDEKREKLERMADRVVTMMRGDVERGLAGMAVRLKTLEDRQPESTVFAAMLAKATAPLVEQIEALKAQLAAIPAPKNGKDGKDADPEIIRAEVARAVSEMPKPKDGESVHPDTVTLMVRNAVAEIPRPADGKSVDPADVQRLIAAEVRSAVSALPPPAAGKDFDPELMRQAVRDEVARAVALLPPAEKGRPGDPGKSVDVVELAAQIQFAAAKVVEAMPRPKDGKDADQEQIAKAVRDAVDALPRPKDGHTPSADELAPIIRAEAERVVAAIPRPENGKPGKDADPALVAALVSGEVAKAIAALPRPKDGEDGKSVTVEEVRPVIEGEFAKWTLDFERRASNHLQRAVERMPKPKDALSVDDFDVEMKDGRTLVMTLRAGDQVVSRETSLEGMPIDRGVYRSGQSAKKGDGVTYGGSYWIATKDTDESPTGPGHHWRLAVKGAK